ncbi:MAG: host-nuclease inhibitor Gam family protein [Chitinophagaceae bacterium]
MCEVGCSRKKMHAEMDVKINAIREQYASRLKITQEDKEEHFDIVQAYCEEHAELFAKKKSMETVFGVLGFRTGTPSLKTKKGYQWAAVIELLKKTLPNYVRVKEEPNKEALLEDRDRINLEEVGLIVDQNETFYVDLKKEEV